MPQVTNTPRVAEQPRGDKTSGVTTSGKGELGEDGRGREGDKKTTTTRATRAQESSRYANEWTGWSRTAPPL